MKGKRRFQGQAFPQLNKEGYEDLQSQEQTGAQLLVQIQLRQRKGSKITTKASHTKFSAVRGVAFPPISIGHTNAENTSLSDIS